MHIKVKQGIDNCYMAHEYEHPGYEEDLCAGLRTLNGDGEPCGKCKNCYLYYGHPMWNNEGDMQKKIDVTISLFYEVRDAEIFGGKGEVGYSQSSIDLHTENLTGFKLQEYAQDQIAGIAKFCKVPQENIRIIKRQEYEENTEED